MAILRQRHEAFGTDDVHVGRNVLDRGIVGLRRFSDSVRSPRRRFAVLPFAPFVRKRLVRVITRGRVDDRGASVLRCWEWFVCPRVCSFVRNERSAGPKTKASNDFSLRFAEMGRTVEYDDADGTIYFSFMVGSEDRSIVLNHHASPINQAGYQRALERTKHYLESLGFRVRFIPAE